ncbi:septal ring lytic transglycosylase RlpA family protein [candidate division KSB1 bacterium]|nr:septal ring lytic transglycosylase RlpA family protein [candidate division KSB1 bacterium]
MRHGYDKMVLIFVVIVVLLTLTCASRSIDDDFFAPRGNFETAPADDNNEPESQPGESSPQVLFTQTGKASYYGDQFQGKSTASGEAYDREKLTAAHRTLPFGSICKVTNVSNGKYVIVRINDRGPHREDRIIDLSYKAMNMVDGINAGIIRVNLEQIR